MLEDRQFFRVGGSEPVHVDVRIIAATNRDLQKAVADGTFREDLFYRLNVIPIHLPPLRDRLEDIPLLVEHFLEQLGAEMNRRVDGVSRRRDGAADDATPGPATCASCATSSSGRWSWPPGTSIQASDLGLRRAALHGREHGGDAGLARGGRAAPHRGASCTTSGGNISQAARTLGIDRATLYNKMRKYQLRKDGEPETDDDDKVDAESLTYAPCPGQPAGLAAPCRFHHTSAPARSISTPR